MDETIQESARGHESLSEPQHGTPQDIKAHPMTGDLQTAGPVP